jgi:glycosyltransferase involved in cell wall biosynthesis
MRLAFYYHIPIWSDVAGMRIPSYLGVFIDSLANEVGHLVLVMHEAHNSEISNCDYIVKSHNITWVNLGYKTPAWHRAVFHKKLLKNKLRELKVDYFLVRSPSPLSPYFQYYFPKKKIRFLIVGDYESSLNSQLNRTFRQVAKSYYLRYNTYLFKKAIRKTPILVNSPALFQKYKDLAPSCQLVGTTTISKKDFFEREDTCAGNIIKLLYTGRIDLQKGLVELVTVTADLINEGFPVELHLVGWEDKPDKPIEKQLLFKARELGIIEKVHFHGKKKVGEELNLFYKMADIYVIPSYHEGFPRTIWEAMANSLPVIASDVGAIPKLLTNEIQALLIPAKDPSSLKKAIVQLVGNSDIRKTMIAEGRKIAMDQTLDVLTKKMIKSLST